MSGVMKFLGMAPPKAPKPEDPIEAPDPEAEARSKSRMLQRKKRSGRTSTVLSEGSGLG